jgi:hypothetical protein
MVRQQSITRKNSGEPRGVEHSDFPTPACAGAHPALGSASLLGRFPHCAIRHAAEVVIILYLAWVSELRGPEPTVWTPLEKPGRPPTG